MRIVYDLSELSSLNLRPAYTALYTHNAATIRVSSPITPSCTTATGFVWFVSSPVLEFFVFCFLYSALCFLRDPTHPTTSGSRGEAPYHVNVLAKLYIFQSFQNFNQTIFSLVFLAKLLQVGYELVSLVLIRLHFPCF